MESRREQEVLQSVLSKAWEDQTFRKNLIEDPVNTIENFTGVKIVLPEGKTLIVIDQSDNSKVYMNIPAEPDFENMELSEDQLEDIAGGGQNVMGDIVNSLFTDIKNFIKL
ncbi:NHLP leader peptide family RiPP precursor [Chryseobacterium sp. Leaf201]|uniref:NHLP leader peptide family RiPP precursor n=1 Tax=Chryseobacterium sp. Leaf201 TaxID=1735672 RepID=UPI0006F8749D|nr:NHLP leader peptide family RiPP precursor [Chryseobacterium sp. Leaf201]KQM19133.1 TOMM propeptide domain-containing protein [Chryseobacterium sp. Leaf201]